MIGMLWSLWVTEAHRVMLHLSRSWRINLIFTHARPTHFFKLIRGTISSLPHLSRCCTPISPLRTLDHDTKPLSTLSRKWQHSRPISPWYMVWELNTWSCPRAAQTDILKPHWSPRCFLTRPYVHHPFYKSCFILFFFLFFKHVYLSFISATWRMVGRSVARLSASRATKHCT
jgi:hypothetical protein